MNKIYKLKFDKRRNELVVVSEITVGMGKEKSTGHLADLTALSPFRKLLGTLTPLAFLTGLVISLFPGMSLAAGLPTGGQVVGGQGSISTSGNQMTIHQQTQNMATNWQSFNIGKNNTVQFVQPDSSSVALNRVTGTSGSQIMGTLKANGQVFILNPNGVLFGKDARVNVAGLVASTKNINTADFMKGQYTLSGEGNPGAQVINQGSLTTTKGGYIVLAGERVSNSGSVSAPSGKVMLAAGKTVTLQLDNGGLTSVSVDGSVVNALVENRGLISATDGRVYLTAKGQNMLLNTVVNNSGTVEAKGLASRGGEIVLDGGDSGVVSQSGQLLADSQTGQGGKITLEGQNIHLAANSLTSATGKAGGGEVFVGGGWQGKDSRIKNASKVVMDKAASVDVSATDTGDGGTAVLWSDDYTNFRGTILARGGAQSGNGGQVETSSHNNLQAFGAVDTSAQSGHGGDWLLDPTDVTIVSAGDDITDNTNITETGKGTAQSLDTDTDHIFSPSASGAQILNTSIENQLNNGTNVTVRTSGTDTEGESGNITLNAAVAKTNGADAALTLEADGNITINNNITSTAGKLDISLLGAGSNTGSVWVLNSTLNSNGGNITLDQLDHKVSTAEGTQINQNALGVKISNSTLNTSGPGNSTGDITIRAYNPGVNLGANEYVNTVRNGGALLEVSGNSSLNSGNITLSGEQSGSVAQSLPVFINGATMTASGDINISGKGMNNARPAQIELRNTGNVLTAGNSITIINDSVGNRGDVLFSSSEGEGAILKAREVSVKASHNVTMVNATVASATNATLNADGNITLNGANVTGNGNISLLGAGNSTARIQVLNSTLNSNGGDITLDQLNHSTTSEDGTTVTSPNAMTVKVSNSTLNTTNTSTSAKGNISIRAYNPNVNLSASAYNNTVRNSGAMIEVSGNSTLTGDYVTLHTDLTGGNARGLPVYLNATNITADNDISLTGRSQSVTTTQTGADGTETSVTASPDTVQIELRGAGNSLTSINGNITIKNDGSSIADGVFLNGTADAKVALNAVNGTIILTGSSVNGTGVNVQNATLNATKAVIRGNSTSDTTSGSGFSLTNVTLGSSLSDLTNVTLSSAGSGAGAINILDSSVVNSSNRDTLLNMTIENLTSVNMDGTAIYNNATAWNKSYETETNPNAGWIFENTSVNASSADLKGVGFINAAINISNGSLNITNNGAAVLSDSNVTVSGGNISIVSGAGKADLTNATLNSSSGAVSVTAQNGDLTLGAGNISAANNITLNAAAGVVSIGAANLTSVNGGININGAAAGGGTGIAITGSSSDKANISAENGTVSLNGTSVSGSGLKLDNVVLNSANAAFTGSSSDSGTGFSLTNTTLQGNLADLNNVTLSSAGSGASVTNILDNTVVNTTNRDTLLNMSIENMTQIDMNGDTAFNGTGAWEKDYGKADNPYSGWIFNNTSINASSVNVAGVGFINSTLNISSGGLDIHNNGSVILTNNNVTVMNGSVNLSSANGSIALDSGNISASGNISIHGNASVSASGTLLNGTDINISGIEGVSLVSANVSGGNISISTQNGTVSVTGSDAQNRTVLNATDNITIDGNQSISGSGYAVTLNQADLTSDNGSVSITGYNSGSGATGGVSLANVNITSMNGSGITLNGTTTSTSESARSGIMVNGGVNITANSTNGIIYMDAKRNALTNNNNYDYYHYGAMNWNGNNSVSAAEINLHGHDTVGAGIMFGDYTAYAYRGGYQVNITFTGNTTINGQGGLYGILLSNKNSYSGTPSSLTFNNGNVELLAKGDKGIFANNIKAAYVPGAIPAEFKYVLNNATLNIVTTSTNGGFGKSNINMAIQGDGNVSVTGHSSGSNAGVDTSILNTNSLNGSLALTGSSASGIGVLVAPNKSYKDVTITGTSSTGNGVVIQNNVTISGGQVNGTSGSASGRGAGVVVNGQTHEFTDIAIVGQSAGSGHGVTVNSISGENVAICGTSTGSGNGVQLNNSVISGVDITGSADNGNGIGVAGSDVTLSGTTLSGSSDNGSGVVLNSAVSADNNTVVTGNSASGSGVVVSAGVSGAVVNGTSEAGSGVVLDGGDVSNAILQGVSTTGSGVEIAGNVSLDDVSAEAVSGTSTEGNGLLLSDGASVGITGFLTSEPVTAPVELGGSSVNGSGVATSGNVSISGVVLNGSATTDEGVGVTLGGNLTIADNISGVNASATGNGTALVLDNATINASGYADNGDNFSIDATVTGDGTAISTTGENTLTSVILNGTGTGNGSAVVINGTLSTDKDIIATSQGANGTGLELSGGTLTGTASDGSPVNITVNAGDTGTVVHVSDGDSELSNVNLTAGVNNGTTLDVSGNLTSNVDITVSTGNGTALNFSGGSIQGAPDATVTVNASATGDTGSAVKVEDGNTGALNSVILNASATDGNAVSVGGTLNTEDADINTQVNGNGTALHVNGGTIQSAGNTTVNATAATGQSVVVNNGMLNSEREGDLIVSATTETDDPAVNISGNSGVTNSQISGQNNGSGSAVVISGSLISDGGGEIIGQTVNGSAVEVMGDTTVSGIALTGSATGSGAGVTVSGENTTLTDTTVSGTTADGTGVKVTGSLTSKGSTTVNGNATGTGSGVDVSGDVTGGSINGSATGSGAGVTVSGENTTLTDTTVSGTTADGTGVKVTGNLTSEGSTTVNGNATGTGSGVDVSGSVGGGQLSGSSVDGVGIRFNDTARLSGTTVSGSSQSGAGISSEGNVQLNNVQLNASSVSGPDLSISGSLSYDRGTNIEASTISGRDSMLSETALPLPALRQGAVNADISRMNQPELDGFHDAGTPAVPVKEYRALPRNVNISICSSEGDCESFSLSSSPKDKTHISRMDALLSDGSRVKCEGGHCRYISAQSSEEKK
ncbi:filamentous hemagglutinin N-terminal domain-containing protein [Salmonella enterica]|nr:filamentous hemagglutinin N-terminal domain-containing protein [Salmonella enterica]